MEQVFEEGFEGDHISRDKFTECLNTLAAENFTVEGLEYLHQLGVSEPTTDVLKEELFKSFTRSVEPLAHQLYDFFDKDGDGSVSRSEVNLTCSTFQANPDGMADSLFQLIDKNDDGAVNPQEMTTFVQGLMRAMRLWLNTVVDLLNDFAGQPLVKSLNEQLFQALDQDGDDKLSKEEVGAALLPVFQMYHDTVASFKANPGQPLGPGPGGVPMEVLVKPILQFELQMQKAKAHFLEACGDADGLTQEQYMAASKEFNMKCANDRSRLCESQQ
jgi:Ca2+-binding EF-hand superfamily protein